MEKKNNLYCLSFDIGTRITRIIIERTTENLKIQDKDTNQYQYHDFKNVFQN